MIIAILDYGAGNIHSLRKALESPVAGIRVEQDPVRAIEADALVLPGVGGFAHAAERLDAYRTVIRERILGGLPTLGICLGMQLFFEGSEEGPGRGLGLAPSHVRRLRANRVPQIGWNSVESAGFDDTLSPAVTGMMYFANSFVCPDISQDRGSVLAWTAHEGDRFPSMIRIGSAVGVQYHPEKSSEAGLRWLRRWIEEVAVARVGSTGRGQ